MFFAVLLNFGFVAKFMGGNQNRDLIIGNHEEGLRFIKSFLHKILLFKGGLSYVQRGLGIDFSQRYLQQNDFQRLNTINFLDVLKLSWQKCQTCCQKAKQFFTPTFLASALVCARLSDSDQINEVRFFSSHLLAQSNEGKCDNAINCVQSNKVGTFSQ